MSRRFRCGLLQVFARLIESLDGDVGAEQAHKVEAIRVAPVEGAQSGIAEESSLEGILADSATVHIKTRRVSRCVIATVCFAS